MGMAEIQKTESTSVDQDVENPHTLLAGVSSGTAISGNFVKSLTHI